MAIRELSVSELSFVAGGNANSNYEGGASSSSYSHGVGYGAQANGFQPNKAAAGHGLLNDLKNPCTAAVASGAIGVAGAIASRNGSGIATAVGSAAVGIGATCPNPANASHSSGGAPFR